MIINDNINKYNSKSGYYNDICYTATSDNDTDITRNDRKNKFIDGNKTICQDDCYLDNYDNNIHQVKCSCKAKESSPSFANMTINVDKLYQNFIKIKNIINLNILKCYRNLFNINGVIFNNGCYVLSFITIIHIISIFVFYCKKSGTLQKKIKDIFFGITHFGVLI